MKEKKKNMKKKRLFKAESPVVPPLVIPSPVVCPPSPLRLEASSVLTAGFPSVSSSPSHVVNISDIIPNIKSEVPEHVNIKHEPVIAVEQALPSPPHTPNVDGLYAFKRKKMCQYHAVSTTGLHS